MLDLNSHRARYDFILQPHRELGKFVANKQLQAIDRFLDDPKLRDLSFDPAKVLCSRLWKEISWYQGNVYSFPFTALTMQAWYRDDLLNDPKERNGFKAKYGYDLQLARDWRQYRDLAEWFTRPDKGMYGTALQRKGGVMTSGTAWRRTAWAVLAMAVVMAVTPYLWLLLTSFKTRVDILSAQPTWRFAPTWAIYSAVFIGKAYLPLLRNSLAIAASTHRDCRFPSGTDPRTRSCSAFARSR
jgi:hypothetical protein